MIFLLSRPLLLAGDFNSTPDSAARDLLNNLTLKNTARCTVSVPFSLGLQEFSRPSGLVSAKDGEVYEYLKQGTINGAHEDYLRSRYQGAFKGRVRWASVF